MRVLRKLRFRLRALFRGAQLDREAEMEMRFHLEQETRERAGDGLAPSEARRAAALAFGGVERVKEDLRDARGVRWLEELLGDVRFGWRMLRRKPAFTAVVVGTLALAIGANTAIFSFFQAILLRPLALEDPQRLVVLKHVGARMPGDGDFSGPDFLDVQATTQSLTQLAAFTSEAATLTGRGPPLLTYAAIVSRNFFSTLGAHAQLGRAFSEPPADAAGGPGAVLSHAFWIEHCGGDREIIGESLTLNGATFTVLGVMPPEFDFPRWIMIWVTPADRVPAFRIGEPAPYLASRDMFALQAVGRLKPGVSREQARAELTALVQRLPSSTSSAARAVRVVSLRDRLVGDVRPALAVLLACVGLVLLIACLNIANLLLARATTRQREIGIRLALGAGRGRIARQLLTESVLLALCGGIAGVWIGIWGQAALLRVITATEADVPRLGEVGFNGWVLLFAAGATLATGVAFGLAPALQTAAPGMSRFLRDGDRGASAGGARQRLRAHLVAAEVALALVLLVAAGLLLRSLDKLQAVGWGFDPANIISLRVGLGPHQLGDPAQRVAFERALLERLRATPGIEAAAVSTLRIGETWNRAMFSIDGRNFAPNETPETGANVVSPDYFRVFGIPVLQGRAFSVADDERAARVAIINATFARRYFPDRSPLGARLRLAGFDGVSFEIVGVVADVRHDGPESEVGCHMYSPYAQFGFGSALFLQVRTPLGAAAAADAARRVLREIDPSLPIFQLMTMEQVIARPGVRRTFPLLLMALFAGLALTLAVVGIYAVTAFAVAQRTREIGIRMALGAQAREVVGHVLRAGLAPVAGGLVAGLAGGALVALAMRKLLFGVAPLDATTFAVVPLLLAVIAALACWWPARRAAKVDPIVALRAE